MVCEFDDGNGWCTGKYKGFGCIESQCEIYAPGQNKRHCQDIIGHGTYCFKFNRFFCAGLDNCGSHANYFRKLKESSS